MRDYLNEHKISSSFHKDGRFQKRSLRNSNFKIVFFVLFVVVVVVFCLSPSRQLRKYTLHKLMISCAISFSKRKRFIIRGDWTKTIECFTVDKFTRKDAKRESKRRQSDSSEVSSTSASAVSLASFSSGSSDGSVTVDTSAPKELWRYQERPSHSKQVRWGLM